MGVSWWRIWGWHSQVFEFTGEPQGFFFFDGPTSLPKLIGLVASNSATVEAFVAAKAIGITIVIVE